MIDNRKTVFSDINTNASIARLLSGLNYEDFQRQQDFLRNIKGNSETNSIVNGILELIVYRLLSGAHVSLDYFDSLQIIITEPFSSYTEEQQLSDLADGMAAAVEYKKSCHS